MTDTERLDFFEAEADKGRSPNLMFDDDGNWAVAYDGVQPAPQGDGQGMADDAVFMTMVPKSAWRPTVREAIDHAIEEARKATALEQEEPPWPS